jgi:large subunit ribosomal protein L15
MPKPQKSADKSKSAESTDTIDKTPLLSRLRAPVGAVQKKHRLGRGSGGGWGTTAGRGQKGQYARNTVRPGFEGGQTPLYRRLPKIGFKNPFSLVVMTVNIEHLKRFDAGSKVDIAQLTDSGLVKGTFDRVKILGDGELDRALTVRAHAFSARAKEQIEKAGGSVELIDPPKVYARAAKDDKEAAPSA